MYYTALFLNQGSRIEGIASAIEEVFEIFANLKISVADGLVRWSSA